ncbi:hypothetical protein GGP77_000622 [Salinibacter ruber]|jgi:hypothetical protein|uniref:HEPN domain-containing protein n=1 Tax=Salinibacter ruber TaxID=146919 RepID=UPI002169A894|nr:HEPN domain-containing protein [Salinibacter ruber]MCS3666417.1 hypothetical protein [Salinibacter ruber]
MSTRIQHYLRTTRWLKAESSVSVSPDCTICAYTEEQARRTAELVRKRNPAARISGPSDFYYQRAEGLGGRTVVEVKKTGQRGHGLSDERLSELARLAEVVVAASLLLQGDRSTFLRRSVGVQNEIFDLHITERARDRSVSSTSQPEKEPTGLIVDDTAERRFNKNGFRDLYHVSTTDTKLSTRLRRCLDWLIQSRTDKSESSALVKTSTALETLVVIGREPTRRALSERGAYILSDDPEERREISRAIKKFYSKRGDIVHGKGVEEEGDISRILEFGDRLAVLIGLVLSANSDRWKNADDVRRYCDAIRWGGDRTCTRPWSKTYLNAALNRLP